MVEYTIHGNGLLCVGLVRMLNHLESCVSLKMLGFFVSAGCLALRRYSKGSKMYKLTYKTEG